jgi:3D-(3,5/4)-trihydroxycyclohexane-1,2-dione acylhydrolase (decyclizing)
MHSERLTVGQAIVRFLAGQYVERDGTETRFIAGVWGIFGHGNVAGLGQALDELGDECEMPCYRPQTEQGQVHIATAFARHRDRLSAFACTSSIGPGATNMITGAATATVNRIPVLLLPSDYFASRLVDPVLQQVEHPVERDVSANDAFRPVSRYFDRITRPAQLLASLPEAFRVLTDPAETGAVTISLPEDVQAEAFDWPTSFFDRRVWHVRRPLPEPAVVARAVERITRAKAPLIVAGGGVRYAAASDALARFASRFGIPVTETQAGKGAIPWDHPMNAGPIGAAGGLAANRLARDADLVITVGTRMGDFVTASGTVFRHPDVELVAINVSPADAAKLRSLAVVADAREALDALGAALDEARYEGTPEAFRDGVRTEKAGWDALVDDYRRGGQTPSDTGDDSLLTQPAVIGIVNAAVGGRATVVCAAGSLPGDLLKLWRPEDPRAYHVEYGFSCMGYEIAAGLGVRMADPDREVVVMVGDGSYLMLNSEIVTAVMERQAFAVVVLDNHGYQCILDLARASGVHDVGNELRYRDTARNRLTGDYVPIDFRAHAEAMGAFAVTARTGDEIRAALEGFAGRDRPTVIVVPTSPDGRVPAMEAWWDVPVAETSGRAEVREARAQYERDAAHQRRDLL